MSKKTDTPHVTVTSDVYGTERFDYPTEQEARAGYERLVESCRRNARKDGVARTVRLVLAKEKP